MQIFALKREREREMKGRTEKSERGRGRERITGASAAMTERPVIVGSARSNISNSSHLQWALLVGKLRVIFSGLKRARASGTSITRCQRDCLPPAAAAQRRDARPRKYWPVAEFRAVAHFFAISPRYRLQSSSSPKNVKSNVNAKIKRNQGKIDG